MSDQIVIYHNPRCSKSRAALQLLRERGIEPQIIEYLKTPPSAARLKQLLAMLDLSPRELMRKGEEPYKNLGLRDTGLDDDTLVATMVDNPILIERPIVVTDGKARLGRPPEQVLELL
jgi:arsenate reductase